MLWIVAAAVYTTRQSRLLPQHAYGETDHSEERAEHIRITSEERRTKERFIGLDVTGLFVRVRSEPG